MEINPLRHTGTSADIAFYSEEDGPVWAAVVTKRAPDYYVIVHRPGVGEVASFRYTPKTKPRGQVLSERTVTRLVREALARRAGA